MYRQLGDAFVLASDAERLLLDLAPDLVEIDEALVEMEELAPFSAVAGGRVDQLENERSSVSKLARFMLAYVVEHREDRLEKKKRRKGRRTLLFVNV
jgi:hypothetical protein